MHPSFIDLRKKRYKDILDTINQLIKDIYYNLKEFESLIESIVDNLKSYNDRILQANKIKAKTRNDLTGFYSDYYQEVCNYADYYYTEANMNLKNILDRIPPSQREYGKKRIWNYCLQKSPLAQLEL